jgi:4Fe-4S ferredoxin
VEKTSGADPDCKELGLLVPIIDRNRCEAKDDCVRVCPYQVFEIGLLSAEDKVGLSAIGRMKAFFHGNRQAFAVRADQCHGCGLCVTACPEHAIKLKRAPAPPTST